MNSKNLGIITKQHFETFTPNNKKPYSLKKTYYSMRSSQKELLPLPFSNPSIQLEKSLQLRPNQQTLQRKTSNFLKSYIEKLKRERKRSNKKVDELNPRSFGKKQTSINKIPRNAQILPKQPSILIFKKSQLLDTRANFCNKLQKYSKDAKFQALLEEIKELKKKEDQQKQKQQKMEAQKLVKLKFQKQKSQTSKMISIKKYENNINLPNLNKTFYNLTFFSQKKQKEYGINQQLQLKSQRKPSQRTKQRIQRLYNFKSLDPWQDIKQNVELQEMVQ